MILAATFVPLTACSATVEQRRGPAEQDANPPGDVPNDPNTPPDAPPDDVPLPDPLREEVKLALEGTHWTAKLEGSLGTYFTWFSFEQDDAMTVTQELKQFDLPQGEVQWSRPGSWSVLDNGDVRRDWTFEYGGADPDAITTTWTFVPLSGLLRDKVFENGWQEPGDEVWTREALISYDGTSYRSHHEHTIDHANGGSEHRMSSGAITLATEPNLGGLCTMQVTLVYADSYGTNDKSGTWSGSLPCAIESAGALWTITADGFSGTDSEVRSQWRDYLTGVGLSDEDVSAMSASFSPRLYVDPANTRVVAFAGAWVEFLERELDAPPQP